MINMIWLDFLNEPFGYMGMGLFWLAWVVQLYQSHKNEKSTIPIMWWILRAIGVGFMLYHSIVIADLMYIISNTLTLLVIYSYNFYLIIKEKQKKGDVGTIVLDTKIYEQEGKR